MSRSRSRCSQSMDLAGFSVCCLAGTHVHCRRCLQEEPSVPQQQQQAWDALEQATSIDQERHSKQRERRQQRRRVRQVTTRAETSHRVGSGSDSLWYHKGLLTAMRCGSRVALLIAAVGSGMRGLQWRVMDSGMGMAANCHSGPRSSINCRVAGVGQVSC